MKTIISKLIAAAAVVAAVTGFDVAAGRASAFGNAPWCANIDEGGGSIVSVCNYASAADCQPNVIAGNRGFCGVNPNWRPTAAAPAARYRHRT